MSKIIILINIFMLFVAALFVPLYLVSEEFATQGEMLKIPVSNIQERINRLSHEIELFGEKVIEVGMIVENQEVAFSKHYYDIKELSRTSASQKKLSDDIYEQKILKMLGPTIATHISDRVEIKIFKLSELGYRGFIAKVKLFDPKAFKVVLAKDKLGELETTSEAAKRKNAILAINGGGFYIESKDGTKYAQMIGNTVIDGKLVEPFNGYPGNLFFAGINKKGEVIGTVPKTEKDILKLDPYHGVSFVPILLKDGKKLEIPEKWEDTKQPRTILGRYANNDLIMIVIDGRQGDWSVGVTLERLQDKLLELGVMDAYNLDGGGSSAMYFNGQVLNRPSDGKERPVVNNIVIMP